MQEPLHCPFEETRRPRTNCLPGPEPDIAQVGPVTRKPFISCCSHITNLSECKALGSQTPACKSPNPKPGPCKQCTWALQDHLHMYICPYKWQLHRKVRLCSCLPPKPHSKHILLPEPTHYLKPWFLKGLRITICGFPISKCNQC